MSLRVPDLGTAFKLTQLRRIQMVHSSLQMFEEAERGTEIVRSVTLIYKRFGKASPFLRNVEALGQPRRTDVPTPPSDFVKEWCRRSAHGTTTTESTVAGLFVFDNVKLAKKLEVFVWSLEAVSTAPAYRTLHYAFMLQVVDM